MKAFAIVPSVEPNASDTLPKSAFLAVFAPDHYGGAKALSSVRNLFFQHVRRAARVIGAVAPFG
jgi:hypothetical protein